MKKIINLLIVLMLLTHPVIAIETNITEEFEEHTTFYAIDAEIPSLNLDGLSEDEATLAIGNWIDEVILVNINLDKLIWNIDFIDQFIAVYYPDKLDLLKEQADNRSIEFKADERITRSKTFSISKSACVYSGSNCVFEGKGTLNWSEGNNYINSINSAYAQRVSGYSAMYSNNAVVYNNNSTSANGTYFFVYRQAFGNDTYQASLTLRIRPTFDGYVDFSVLLSDHLWIGGPWSAPPIGR